MEQHYNGDPQRVFVTGSSQPSWARQRFAGTDGAVRLEVISVSGTPFRCRRAGAGGPAIEAGVQQHGHPALVGNPVETATVVATLILGGVKEQLPRLRIWTPPPPGVHQVLPLQAAHRRSRTPPAM
ncbi:hypothetical protein ACWGMA_37915 [Streptomyces asiaticus]